MKNKSHFSLWVFNCDLHVALLNVIWFLNRHETKSSFNFMVGHGQRFASLCHWRYPRKNTCVWADKRPMKPPLTAILVAHGRPIPPLVTIAFHTLRYGSIRGIISDEKLIHLPCVATLRTGAGNLTQAYADVTSRWTLKANKDSLTHVYHCFISGYEVILQTTWRTIVY